MHCIVLLPCKGVVVYFLLQDVAYHVVIIFNLSYSYHKCILYYFNIL